MIYLNPCEKIRVAEHDLQHRQQPGAANFGEFRSTPSRWALANPAPFHIPFQDRSRGEMRQACDGQ